MDSDEKRKFETELREQRYFTQVLNNASLLINSTLEQQEVLEHVATQASHIFKTETIFVLLLENGSLHLAHFWSTGKRPSTLASGRIFSTAELPFLEPALQNGWPLTLTISDQSEWALAPYGLGWVCSLAIAPIIMREQVSGFLCLGSSLEHSYDPNQLERLSLFANQAALGLQNVRQYRTIRRQLEHLSVVYRVGLAINADLDLFQVCQSIHAHFGEAAGIGAFDVALFDPTNGALTFPYSFEGGLLIKRPDRRQNSGSDPLDQVIRQGKTLYLPGAPDGSLEPQPAATTSFLGIPLFARNQVIGVIAAQSLPGAVYQPDQLQLLETLAAQAAIAINNARLYAELEQMAITDALTGLHNRRRLFELAASEFARSQRYHHPLTLIMLDIDHFKQFNDTYGHPVGDIVLRHVAQVCMQSIRKLDFSGRYGGEEFMFVLPETSLEAALLIARRLLHTIRRLRIETFHGPLQVTASLGVADWRDEPGLEALIQRVDAALYQAKRLGRNQVYVG